MTIVRSILAIGLLGLACSANAVPVTFDLDGASSSVEVRDFEGSFLCGLSACGIDATLSSGFESLSATLEPGESWTFHFFDLSFHGLGSGSGTIAASLGFDSPIGAPNAEGTGSGGFLTAFGAVTGGNLTWATQPGTFSLLDGTMYSVFLENLDGLALGTVAVNGTITLLQGPGGSVSVPEPGTIGLLGMALLGMGLGARRKAKNKALA